MAAIPIPTGRVTVELRDDAIRITDLDLDGTIVEVAKRLDSPHPAEIERLVRDAVEVGARILGHGQNQAIIDAITTEISRLIETTNSTTDTLPKAIHARVAELLEQLARVLADRFDQQRVDSIPNQIRDLVATANAEQIRNFTRELVEEAGPLQSMNDKVVAQVKALNGTAQDVLAKVATLADKIEAKMGLDDARERSTQKGAPFEEVVQAELEAFAGPLGDDVRCVRQEYGVANTQAGDLLVVVNPAETRGRTVAFVVEAKTGKLTSPKARQALEDAIENRDACAGLLVFDDVADAPTRGRRYASYPSGRFVVVFDPDDDQTLALEVAYHQARAIAIASVDGELRLDARWLVEQCDRVAAIIEQAREIKNGANAARRGLDRVDASYAQLRAEALAVLEEIKNTAA